MKKTVKNLINKVGFFSLVPILMSIFFSISPVSSCFGQDKREYLFADDLSDRYYMVKDLWLSDRLPHDSLYYLTCESLEDYTMFLVTLNINLEPLDQDSLMMNSGAKILKLEIEGIFVSWLMLKTDILNQSQFVQYIYISKCNCNEENSEEGSKQSRYQNGNDNQLHWQTNAKGEYRLAKKERWLQLYSQLKPPYANTFIGRYFSDLYSR